jgi:hypothetical protein
MAHEDVQSMLKDMWLGGKEGALCGREQSRAWALRDVWKSESKSEYGMFQHIASKLRKNKRGKPNGPRPTGNAVKQLFEKIDDDPEWHPGKFDHDNMGAPRVLKGGKLGAFVRSAQKIQHEHGDVTFPLMVASCPKALVNPKTDKIVDKRAVYRAFAESCRDEGAEDTWGHHYRSYKEGLTDPQIAARYAYGLFMQRLGHTAQYYFDRLVWTDLCNSVAARTPQKALEQAMARKGKKGWFSKSKKLTNNNLKKSKTPLKQASWGTVRLWWAPILTRGKLHIEYLGEDFPGETEAGAMALVPRVKAALNIRFQGCDAPTTLYVDRGQGFWHSNTGRITDGFRQALRDCGLRAYWGDDASRQPGALQELLLHETAVSWIRFLERRTLPKNPWDETAVQFCARLKNIAATINRAHDVEGLCMKLPTRIDDLVRRKGERIDP